MKELIGSRSRFLISIALLFVVLSILNSCTKTTDNMTPMGSGTGAKGTGGPGTNEVWIQGMVYNPASITVASGTTIKWTNKDGVAHTVTSKTGLFDSGTISNNGTYSFTFSTAGTFQYYCTIHPTMIGSVVAN